MQFEPMIKARINSFNNNHTFRGISDDRLFELFVNDAIFRSHQSDIEEDLLDECSVGGSNDMGIDGIAIKVNGIFVSSQKEIDELIELNKQISIEFVFIQSKNKDRLDSGEFGKFTDGIVDFLSDNHNEPHNDKIDSLLMIKNHLFSDSVILRWKTNPTIRVYYVYLGQWQGNEHIIAKKDKLVADITSLQSYEETIVNFIDSAELKRICEENENSFSTVLTVIDNFGLTEVPGVDNSLVALFSAVELLKIITTADKRLRQNIFTDNVRDYQGDTTINSEIMETIKSSPSNFALLNNGITIVCSSVTVSNRKLSLINPQIVNGCQTCNVLFDASFAGIDLSKVSLLAKVIATEKDELTTAVIRGTNSQNTVYNEAFETTREFHKHLEEFFNVIQPTDQKNRIYYERRSRQFARDPSISPGRVIGLKALTQSFVGTFYASPHLSTSHEAIILKKFKNVIFVDGQSFLPYYVSSLLCLNFEELRRDGTIDREIENFKYHTMFIVCESVAGVCPSINNTRQIDNYCNKLLPVISNPVRLTKEIRVANDKLQGAIKKWVQIHGPKYRYGIKDNANFTKFLITYIRGGDVDKIEYESEQSLIHRGRVIKCRRDRMGFFYGFIQNTPDDVFFHERDNESFDFNELYGKTVLYHLFSDSVNGENHAKIIEIVSE